MQNIISKIKSYKVQIIIFTISIISINLYKFSIISLIIALSAFISSIVFLRKKYKYIIVPLVISLIMIIISSIITIKNIINNTDVYKNENLILGSWNYNEFGGTYNFKDDYTYIQYSNSNKDDNYCTGTYKYHYGATSNDGITIRQDENYYYYDLTLNEDKCIIMGQERIDKYTKNMVFSITKNNISEVIMMNKENNSIFNLEKVD